MLIKKYYEYLMIKEIIKEIIQNLYFNITAEDQKNI